MKPEARNRKPRGSAQVEATRASWRARTRRYRARHPDRFYDSLRRWEARNPGKKALYRLRSHLKLYGLTVEEYERLLKAQKSVCAICRRPERVRLKTKVSRLSIDHCHTKKKVRGLLCVNCNQGLGHFRDDPKRLRAAAAYLEKRR